MNINDLTIEEQKPSGQTYYLPVVLTVRGVSQFNDSTISFVELKGFWSLPANYVFSRVSRDHDGSKMRDGTMRQGDVARFGLNTNPKRNQNAAPGAVHNNVGTISNPKGEKPVDTAADNVPPTAPGLTDDDVDESPVPVDVGHGKILPTPAGDYYMTPKDYNYVSGVEGSQSRDRQVEALRLLITTINAYVPLAEKVESLKAMDFNGIEEAKAVAGREWQRLRDGETPFVVPAAPVPHEPAQEVGMPPDPQDDDDVQELSW